MKILIAILALIVPAGWLLAASESEPPALKNNPFSRPPSERIVSTVTPPIGVAPVEEIPLELQATMIGTVTSFATVDGKILKRGDEIHGYTLVAIRERYAIFERGGRQTTVYVRPAQTEEQTVPGRRR